MKRRGEARRGDLQSDAGFSKVLLIVLIVAVLGAGGYAAWIFFLADGGDEPTPTSSTTTDGKSTTTSPPTDSTKEANASLRTALATAEALKADSGAYITTDLAAFMAELEKSEPGITFTTEASEDSKTVGVYGDPANPTQVGFYAQADKDTCFADLIDANMSAQTAGISYAQYATDASGCTAAGATASVYSSSSKIQQVASRDIEETLGVTASSALMDASDAAEKHANADKVIFTEGTLAAFVEALQEEESGVTFVSGPTEVVGLVGVYAVPEAPSQVYLFTPAGVQDDAPVCLNLMLDLSANAANPGASYGKTGVSGDGVCTSELATASSYAADPAAWGVEIASTTTTTTSATTTTGDGTTTSGSGSTTTEGKDTTTTKKSSTTTTTQKSSTPTTTALKPLDRNPFSPCNRPPDGQPGCA